jgi:hypothetical protein
MAKERKKTPRPISDAVLKEFNYRCAIGGEDRPQLHHIDENPENNDPMNLLPLCPNCHLTDQHNPTAKIPIGILRLFREYKDPAILKPQFKPIYDRMSYLYSYYDLSCCEIEEAQRELSSFIACLEMGKYYQERIWNVNPVSVCFTAFSLTADEVSRQIAQQNPQFHQIVAANGKKVEQSIIELLRYQQWSYTEPKFNRS